MLRGEAVDPVELPRPTRPERRWFWQRAAVPTAITTDEGWQPTSAIDAEKSSTGTHSLIP
jgi:hypothetical protein